MNDLRTPVFALIIVLAIVAALTWTSFSISSSPQPQAVTTQSSSTIPPITPAEQAILNSSKGFQVLISYTDTGFSPATVAIKKGDTVRFTNNSSEDLWVASSGVAGGNVYPAQSGNECGQSAFDSCHVIGRGGFWEFTFAKAGAWGYRNNRDGSKAGVIQVK